MKISPTKTSLFFIIASILVISVFLLWALWATFGVRLVLEWWLLRYDADYVQLAGQTGDLFGGVNAIFAALAFVGVAMAAWFQRETLQQIQREHAAQQAEQARQAFEPLFFRLLEMNSNIPVWPLKTKLLADDVTAAEVVKKLTEVIGNENWYVVVAVGGDAATDMAKGIEKHYGELYGQSEEVLGPYFRTLYHIFKLIDRAAISADLKVEYANIARATLSRDVVFLLMLNGATQRGAEFKPLIEKYGLLKHLRVRSGSTDVMGSTLATALYEATATMGSAERQLWAAREVLGGVVRADDAEAQ